MHLKHIRDFIRVSFLPMKSLICFKSLCNSFILNSHLSLPSFTNNNNNQVYSQQSEEGRHMEKKAALYLPPEVIIQILLWLPVKSLMCFKSVCKLWFTLISDPSFANCHFQLAPTHTSRIVSISAVPPQIRSIDFVALLNDNSASPNSNLSLPQSYFPLQMKGSCRGFVFLHSSSNNYLWNPSTGFCKLIPLSPIDSNFGDAYDYLYGFGYDKSRDDYLVVLLSYDIDPAEDDGISSHLEVFSLRDNTWKEIEDTRLPCLGDYNYPTEGLLFNGAIHWIGYCSGGSVDAIVAFDLIERKLLEIPLPYYFDLYNSDIGLWVFGEFLSLWAMWDGAIEIWVMKEYGVQLSWTMPLVFPIVDIPYFSPIYSTKNGDIIGTIGGTGLAKFSRHGVLLGQCSYCGDPRESQVVMYTESLLSLPGDNKQVLVEDINKMNEAEGPAAADKEESEKSDSEVHDENDDEDGSDDEDDEE